MANEIIDRGDELEATGDTPGETGDLDKKDDAALGEEGKKELGLDKEDKTDKKEPAIPKGRFDEAVGKARREAEAATKRADDLEAQLKANQGVIDVEKIEERIDDLEEELEKARADGLTEKAKTVRQEIRRLNRQVSDSAAAAHAAHATAKAVEEIRYGALVSTMEAERPELNPDNEEEYDEAMVAEITEYKEAFEAKGLSSSEALKKALKAVPAKAKKVDPDKDDAKEDLEESAEEKQEKAEKAAKAASERKEAAVKKALEDKKKQPADSKKTGLDSDKAGQQGKQKPPSKMTDKEWDALPEDERKRLRGDDL